MIRNIKWIELSQPEREGFFRRSEQDISAAGEAVAPIVEDVRSHGDRAVRAHTKRLDGADIEAVPLAVTEEEFTAAERSLPADLKAAIDEAITNVRRFHEDQLDPRLHLREVSSGVLAGERATAIDSAALYVPRGRGSFPSMVYMLALPATVAGVEQIAVTSPCRSDGTVDPACLYAARRCGVTVVYRVGGAQAIAALAYGTESIRPVHKIVGPGSAYVAAAKRLVAHVVDTGLPAGPSESMIVADKTADPWKLSLDLLTEAEHGDDSAATLLTPSAALAEAVQEVVESILEAIPEPRRSFAHSALTRYGGIVQVDSIAEAVRIVNRYAPEHLQLHVEDPFTLLPQVRRAGEILLGGNTPFALANYAAGPNAVLPTGGWARVHSPVSVRDFQTVSSVVYASQDATTRMTDLVSTIADYEGFPAHAAALRNRTAQR